MQNVEKTQDDILNEAQKLVERNIILLNWRAPFFGAIISSLNREYSFSLQPATMAVTTDTLYIHPEFAVKNPDVVLFALCHEALHVAFEHVCRLPQGDKWLRNIAADYVVNGIIAERETLDTLQVKLPGGILYDPKFKDLCLEEVYNILLKQQQTQPQQGQGQQGQGQQGQGQQGQGQQGQGQQGHKTFDAHDWSSTQDQQAVARVRDIVMRAAITAKVAGKLPGAIQRALENIEESRIDWKEILAAFLVAAGDREDYASRPSVLTASVADSIGDWTWVPALDGVRAGKVGVVIDTSGSIDDATLRIFLGEVLALQHAVSELHVYYADAAVQSTVTFTEYDTPTVEELVTKCVGGGGTDFRPAITQAIGDGCESIVYLTDGYGTFPDTQPDVPVLWVLTERGATLPGWGETIYIPPSSGH